MADARTIIKQLLDDEAESAKPVWPGKRQLKYLFTHETPNVYDRSETLEYHVFIDESGELFAHRPTTTRDMSFTFHGPVSNSIARAGIENAYQAYLDNQ